MATSFLLQRSPSPGCCWWHLVLEPSQWPQVPGPPLTSVSQESSGTARVKGLYSFHSQQIFHPAISDLHLFNFVFVCFVLNCASSLNSPQKSSKIQINFKSPMIWALENNHNDHLGIYTFTDILNMPLCRFQSPMLGHSGCFQLLITTKKLG